VISAVKNALDLFHKDGRRYTRMKLEEGRPVASLPRTMDDFIPHRNAMGMYRNNSYDLEFSEYQVSQKDYSFLETLEHESFYSFCGRQQAVRPDPKNVFLN